MDAGGFQSNQAVGVRPVAFFAEVGLLWGLAFPCWIHLAMSKMRIIQSASAFHKNHFQHSSSCWRCSCSWYLTRRMARAATKSDCAEATTSQSTTAENNEVISATATPRGVLGSTAMSGFTEAGISLTVGETEWKHNHLNPSVHCMVGYWQPIGVHEQMAPQKIGIFVGSWFTSLAPSLFFWKLLLGDQLWWLTRSFCSCPGALAPPICEVIGTAKK